MAETVDSVTADSVTAAGIIERILQDRERIRAFILEYSRLGTDETAKLLGGYGTGSESERKKELLPIIKKVQEQSINDFLIDYTSWTDSSPIRSAFKAILGDDISPKIPELRDALNYVCYYKKIKDSTAKKASGNPNTSASWSCPRETLYDIANTLLFAFADIPLLGTDDMCALLGSVDIQEIALALKSEPPETIRKFTSAMAERDASFLKEDMEFMGPCRLRDVIAAQNKISLAIEHLIESGKIKPPTDLAAEESAQCCDAVCCDDTSPLSERMMRLCSLAMEDISRSVIDYAVTIRSAIRAFILKETEENASLTPPVLLQEVQRTLSMYSEEGDRRAAELLWRKKRDKMIEKIYSVSIKGDDGELIEFLKCVPRAQTKNFLDELAEEDKRLRNVIRSSVLWRDDVLMLSSVAVREVMRHCTAPVIAKSLAGATGEVRGYILTRMFHCDDTDENLPSETCEHWACAVARREMDVLIDKAVKTAAPCEIDAARDEVLNAITGAEEVKKRLLA